LPPKENARRKLIVVRPLDCLLSVFVRKRRDRLPSVLVIRGSRNTTRSVGIKLQQGTNSLLKMDQCLITSWMWVVVILFVRSFIHSFIHLFIHLFICSFIRSFVNSFIY